MNKPRLLFCPEACNLAEVTRMVEIAKACRSDFEIMFSSHGGKFESLIEEADFALERLEPQMSPEQIERFYRVDRGEEFGRIFEPAYLDQRIDAELALLKRFEPRAAITGFCLSLPISMRIAKLPLVWVIGSPWLPEYFDAGLGTWPDMFDLRPLRWIPERALDWLANRTMAFFLGMFIKEFNDACKRRGVAPFKGTEFWQGDHALLAEPAEMFGLDDLPPDRFTFIGPLIAKLDVPIPEQVSSMPRDKPIVFFAMGSSGQPEIIAAILRAFGGKPYRVIAPVKSVVEKLCVKVPDNVVVTGLLPAHKVNPMADLSVIHGGIGTVMTACLAGTPVVGVGMQPEQEANLECLVRKGFAIRIRKKRVTAKRVIEAVDTLLADPQARDKATAFKQVVERWDGPGNAAQALRERFG